MKSTRVFALVLGTVVGLSMSAELHAGAGSGLAGTDSAAFTPPLEFTVNTTEDTVDPNPGDGVAGTGGQVSLRAAVMEANAHACPGPVVIHLPGGNYVSTLGGLDDDTAVSGDLDILGCITILGAGADRTVIDGNDLDRVFDVFADASLTIEDATVANGSMSSGSGGGIRSQGDLTLRRVTVRDNESTGGSGGLRGAGTTLAEDCTFTGNWSRANGGGISCSAFTGVIASMTLHRCTIYDNASEGNGGGFFSAGSDIADLFNCTISGNRADGTGGGVFSNGSLLTFHSCTITNNTADFDADGSDTGGGIRQSNGYVTIANTIIATNEGPPGTLEDLAGYITSAGYNLIGAVGDATILGDVTGNLMGLNPGLGPLANNGGFGWTHALLATSPALDAANPDDYPDTDQRGEARPSDGDSDGTPRADIGAFERIVFPGDFDGDEDVDLDDHALFTDCMAGPGERPAPSLTSVSNCLTVFDFNIDGDIDAADFLVLQAAFTAQ